MTFKPTTPGPKKRDPQLWKYLPGPEQRLTALLQGLQQDQELKTVHTSSLQFFRITSGPGFKIMKKIQKIQKKILPSDQDPKAAQKVHLSLCDTVRYGPGNQCTCKDWKIEITETGERKKDHANGLNH